jgi:cytochrome c5
MRLKIVSGTFLVMFAITAWAATGGPQSSAAASSATSTANNQQKSSWQSDAAEGEKRFAQNCGRCHTPPSSISPRIAKAVLRHMRVRASLSKEDERYILKFLAPTVEP